VYPEQNGIKWFMNYAGMGLGSDYYYPYVVVTPKNYLDYL